MSRLSVLLFQSSPLPILIVEQDGLRLDQANPAATRLLGKSSEELAGQDLDTLLGAKDAERVRDLMSRGHGPHVLTAEAHIADEARQIELRFSLLDTGGEEDWLFFLRDVTRERQAMEALRHSEREYRRLVENSPDAIAVIQDGVVVYANGATERLLRLATPDLLWGSEFESFVHPDDLDLWRQRETAVRQEKQIALGEIRLLRPGGATFEAEVAQFAIQREEGLGMQVSLRDISQRKEFERRIRESEERYKGLADVAFDGVAVHFEGVLLTANRTFESIFGHEPGSTLGMHIQELIHPDDRELFFRELDSGRALEFRGRKDDGGLVSIEISSRACIYHGDPAYVSAIRDISDRKRQEAVILEQAHTDSLTGLPNRALLQDRMGVALEQARRRGGRAAVLFIDLDRFKIVNDSLGHGVGDLMLIEASRRIEQQVRKSDTVARLGGDEFTILLPEVADVADAAAVARKVIEAINAPFYIHDNELRVGASIGVSMFPDHASDVERLLKLADMAMYKAKDNGRNHVQVYQSGLTDKQENRLDLENRLRAALEKGGFELFYQPKVTLADGAMKGAEALLRWRQEDGSVVSPDDFIPLAEETGLILPLGEWVLREACKQAATWPECAGSPVSVSVNLSAWQLHRRSLLKSVDLALSESGLPPERLELEITESAAMRDPEHTLAMLEELRTRGVMLSLDDFGKGYSSLTYLRQFPVHVIKIDQSFVKNLPHSPKDAAIIRAVVLLSRSLGLRTLAEGIETKEQWEALREMGCDEGQGYLFARPMPPADFLAALRGAGATR